jgi:hypothetical protein
MHPVAALEINLAESERVAIASRNRIEELEKGKGEWT